MGVSFHGSKAIQSLASTRYASISLYQSPKMAGHNGAFNWFEVAFQVFVRLWFNCRLDLRVRSLDVPVLFRKCFS